MLQLKILPTFIQQAMQLNLIPESEKKYIEIIVEPYPNPVNYKGQYHYRSGSTKQELKGAALDKFLLQRYGKTWDSVPVPRISVDDLDENAFNIFRKKGKNSGRVDDDVLNDSNFSILENLDLLEDKYMTRAGILLFHPKPDKLFTGSFIKIILYVQENGRIANTEVQEICNVSKRTASNYLIELEKDYLDKVGETGKGTYYKLKGQ